MNIKNFDTRLKGRPKSFQGMIILGFFSSTLFDYVNLCNLSFKWFETLEKIFDFPKK